MTRPCPTRWSTHSWTAGSCRARKYAKRLAGYSVRVRLRRDRCEIGTRWTIRGIRGFQVSEDSGPLGVGGGVISSGQYPGLKSVKSLKCVIIQ
eukprot:scaffold45615_cov63-Phaeocystis_antarctica.AAC.5